MSPPTYHSPVIYPLRALSFTPVVIAASVHSIPHNKFERAFRYLIDPTNLVVDDVHISVLDMQHDVVVRWTDANPLRRHSHVSLAIVTVGPESRIVVDVKLTLNGEPYPGIVLRSVLATAVKLRRPLALRAEPSSACEVLGADSLFAMAWRDDKGEDQLNLVRLVGATVDAVILPAMRVLGARWDPPREEETYWYSMDGPVGGDDGPLGLAWQDIDS